MHITDHKRAPISTFLLMIGVICTPQVTQGQNKPSHAPRLHSENTKAKVNEPSPQTTSPEYTQAKKLYNQAEVEYRLGNFQQALSLYQKALRLVERPSLIFNVAQCYSQLGDWKKALFHYQYYLDIWSRQNPHTPAPNLAGVHRKITQMKLNILKEDSHTQETSASGKKPPTIIIPQPANQHQPPARAKLRIGGLSIKGATVLVDGTIKAVSPVEFLIDVPPGVHHVSIRAKGYLHWDQMVKAAKGQVVFVPVFLKALPGRSRFWLLMTLSSGVLAAGAEAMAIAYYARAEDLIHETQAFRDERSMVVLGHVLAGGFLTLSAVSLYFYLTSGRMRQSAEKLSSSIFPINSGAMALGQFSF